MYFLFTEDFKKYLNMSSNEEIDHLLKCLSEDIIQDENMISQEDIQRLCAEIDFEEEIPENFHPIYQLQQLHQLQQTHQLHYL